jgi:hypothetical protein
MSLISLIKKIIQTPPRKIVNICISFLPTRISNDKYVPMFYARPYRYITFIPFFQRLRVKYWSAIAMKYEPFAPFYSKVKREKILAKESPLSRDIKNIYENGFSLCENFLSKSALLEIKEKIKDIKLDENLRAGFQVETLPVNTINEILRTLEPFYKHFFPYANIQETPPSMIIRIDYSTTGIDPSPITANWHVDRFIPTLNAIFFPEGSDWGSFEKDVGSPIISEKYIEYYSKFRPTSSKNKETRDLEYKDLNGEKKIFDVAPNSLLIGSHHMQHRRTPYTQPGKRVAIFIDFYDVLPTKDLKKYANKNF